MSEPLQVTVPPAIFRIGGKTYAIAGAWIEIPPETTFTDLNKYVVYTPGRIPARSTAVPMLKPKDDTVVLGRVEKYDIVRRKGKVCCTCPGFVFRKSCRHIREWKG